MESHPLTKRLCCGFLCSITLYIPSQQNTGTKQNTHPPQETNKNHTLTKRLKTEQHNFVHMDSFHQSIAELTGYNIHCAPLKHPNFSYRSPKPNSTNRNLAQKHRHLIKYNSTKKKKKKKFRNNCAINCKYFCSSKCPNFSIILRNPPCFHILASSTGFCTNVS